MKQDYTN